MAITYGRDGYLNIKNGIAFSSDKVTNAPVSRVYFNDELVWAVGHTVTIKFAANTLSEIKYTTVGVTQQVTEQSIQIQSGATSITQNCIDKQAIFVTPVPKTGYVVTSYHDTAITVTGDMTITITTKAATKGKLSKPVLTGGSSGRVDGNYRCYGNFENRNSITVSAVANVFYIDGTPKQDSDHALQSGQTYSNIYPKSNGTGYTVTAMAEGRGMESFKGKHLIAIKFTADGYEDSDWAFWSDYSQLVNSSAYTTGQIPVPILNENQQQTDGDSLEGYAEYADPDNDGDYDIFCWVFADHPLDWPAIILSPKGTENIDFERTTSYSRRAYIGLSDVPPDNLMIKLTCYDPLGLFKSSSVQITQENLTKLESSEY